MSRFNISLIEAIDLVFKAIKIGKGGEIFVPKLKSFYIRDLIEAITNKKNFYKIVGIRPGEKIHEELINAAEIKDTIVAKNHYVVLSNFTERQIKNYCKKNSYKRVDENFSYDSGTNPNFMTIKELKRIVKVYSKN